jgi:chitin disaccharide deacetylase
MKLIINCDDFGVSYGVNYGIKEAFEKGSATSASIRTNGPAFRDAVELSKTSLKNMGLGIHLNLTDGKPHTKKLSNNKGFYKYNFLSYLILTEILKDKNIFKSVKKELELQFQICREYKLKISHVDGQDHIQMLPAIFEIICRLCNQYKISKIRISYEPYFFVKPLNKNLSTFINFGFAKQILLKLLAQKCKRIIKKYNLKSTDVYFGVLHTNQMDIFVLKSIINQSLKNKYSSVEIALHPAEIHYKKDHVYTSPFFSKYANLKNRDLERKTLLDKNLKKIILQEKIDLVSFKEI